MSSKRVGGLEKREIALAQLRRAIQLFRQEDFVCAATLAGAAEEILGRIAQKRSGCHAMDGEEAFVEQLADFFNVAKPDKPKIRRVLNRVRNECKHNDSGGNEWVTADFEYEAQCLIDRALRNWLLAYGSFPKDRIVSAYHMDFWM